MEKNAFSLRIFFNCHFLYYRRIDFGSIYNHSGNRTWLKKDDLQITSLAHLTKSMDWENDYNEEKIGERILNARLTI